MLVIYKISQVLILAIRTDQIFYTHLKKKKKKTKIKEG